MTLHKIQNLMNFHIKTGAWTSKIRFGNYPYHEITGNLMGISFKSG